MKEDKNKAEDYEISYGTCRFCGQRMTIRGAVGQALTQTQLDEIATGECNCQKATFYRDNTLRIRELKKKIEKECKDIEMQDVLKQLVENIGSGIFESVTVKTGEIKYQIARTSAGKLKFTRIRTEKISEES